MTPTLPSPRQAIAALFAIDTDSVHPAIADEIFHLRVQVLALRARIANTLAKLPKEPTTDV